MTNQLEIKCKDCHFRKMAMQFMNQDEFELICKIHSHAIYDIHEPVLRQNNPSTHLLFLHRGVVKFNFRNESGKNFIMTIVSGPKLLGGANLFFKDYNIFSIITMSQCDICLIDSTLFSKALVQNPAFFAFLLRNTMDMFQASVFNFISIAHKQVPGRIADVLLYLWENVYKDTENRFIISRKEIAEFAACSHENAIITLSKLRKEGVIKVENKEFIICNLNKLKEISSKG